MHHNFHLSSGLSLWIGDIVFINRVGLWRVMFGNPDKIVLQIDLPDTDRILTLSDGFSLDIFHRKYGRLDTKDGAELVASFTDCQLKRKWIPQPSSRGVGGHAVSIFAEYTCKAEGEWTQ